MECESKFNIISEGQKFGISKTCKKYNISRTLYYRWLNRYKTNGMDGLGFVKKNFTPINKTAPEVVDRILMLIKSYPRYGPREIKFLLEELGYHISESAVYNLLKRSNLSTKEKRIKFSKKKISTSKSSLLQFEAMNSGECWFFWITPYGQFTNSETLYNYTIFDYKSKIACSRLYRNLSSECFEDLLTAVALPVAQGLSFNMKHLCFFEDHNIPPKSKLAFLDNIQRIVQYSGYDITMHLLEGTDQLTALEKTRKDYNHYCLSFLMPFFQSSVKFNEIKILLQKHIRDYNINQKFDYEGQQFSPIEYHMHSTGSDMILPLWAYIDRSY